MESKEFSGGVHGPSLAPFLRREGAAPWTLSQPSIPDLLRDSRFNLLLVSY